MHLPCEQLWIRSFPAFFCRPCRCVATFAARQGRSPMLGLFAGRWAVNSPVSWVVWSLVIIAAASASARGARLSVLESSARGPWCILFRQHWMSEYLFRPLNGMTYHVARIQAWHG